MGQWSETVKPIVGKLRVGAEFGETVFNQEGSRALAATVATMAGTLDVAATAQKDERIAELEAALSRFLEWGSQQCPCSEEKPDPCPLCGASVENLEACKAIESKFPRDILMSARAALSKGRR
jgi:hypothetical protein